MGLSPGGPGCSSELAIFYGESPAVGAAQALSPHQLQPVMPVPGNNKQEDADNTCVVCREWTVSASTAAVWLHLLVAVDPRRRLLSGAGTTSTRT